MRVVLDGVFNHASRGFWPFHHVLENGGDSPYVDWFYIEDWPLNPYPNGPDIAAQLRGVVGTACAAQAQRIQSGHARVSAARRRVLD